MTKTSLNIVLCQHDSHTITMGFVTFNTTFLNLQNLKDYHKIQMINTVLMLFNLA